MDPVAFRIFGISVYWYGIMISLGMLAGIYVALKRTRQYGLTEDELINFALVVVPAAVIGARLAFVIANWESFAGDWLAMINIRQGGLAIHGAIFVAIIVCVIYSYIKKMSFWRIADTCAPSLILGQAIGRWGNFFNQEAYGVPTDLPWAMYIDGAYRHPIFLYESIWNLLVFLYLLYVSRKEKTDGGIFLRYLIGYSIGRFFIEGIRADTLYWGNFRAGQVVSILLILVGTLLLWWRKQRQPGSKGGVTK
ncbi:MAG: prolipoprotein diacylglyceryl transferase [Firmicutes bacterium]|nr:prolipoprotein diacylglyceryl transferase [Bacillota bacterium]